MEKVGLRLLLVEDDHHQQVGDGGCGNSCATNMLKLLKTSPASRKPTPNPNDWFLSSCYLCHTSLNPAKDIYMYRGDKGFCSIDCRERQIFIDEMKDRQSLRLRLRLRSQDSQHKKKTRPAPGSFETSILGQA